MNRLLICSLVYFLGIIGICGQEKYIVINIEKDSIIKRYHRLHYKIKDNFFDIERYSEIDTICQSSIDNKDVSSIEDLFKDYKTFIDEYVEKNKNKDSMLILDSINLVYEYIYLLVPLSIDKYRRIRVYLDDSIE